MQWDKLAPDQRHFWFPAENEEEFETYIPMGTKEAKSSKSMNVETIFKTYTLGTASNKDEFLYNFDSTALKDSVKSMIDVYDYSLFRVRDKGELPEDVIDEEDKKIKWTRKLKKNLSKHLETKFSTQFIRNCVYRPFCRKFLYYDPFWVEEPRPWLRRSFPAQELETENLAISVSVYGRIPFSSFCHQPDY